jgi:hypothetical protein
MPTAKLHGTVGVIAGTRRSSRVLIFETNTGSCGCRSSRTGAANIKHGHVKHYQKSPEYRAWCSAIERCYRPTNAAYPWYGGAGVKVCKRWRGSFSAFLMDMGLKPAPDFMLVRRQKDRDYTPSNCEWGTIPSKQAEVSKSFRQTDRPTVVASGRFGQTA